MKRRLGRYVARFDPGLWSAVAVVFVAYCGYSAFWPFIALWLTGPLGASPRDAGIIIMIGTIAGMAGSLYGGSLSDRIGRRPVVVVAMALGAVRMVALTQADSLLVAAPLLLVGDVIVASSLPAVGALVADLVPDELLDEGYALQRMASNAAWVIGPALGGLAAQHSYDALFLGAAVMLALAFALAFVLLRGHGRPRASEHRATPRIALRDRRLVAFLGAVLLAMVLFGWFESVVPLYLRDEGLGLGTWGLLLGFGAALVVALQIPVSRWASRRPPAIAMGLGSSALGAGVALFATSTATPALLGSTALVMGGQMLLFPIGSAVVTRMAPDGLRGTYQGAWGTTVTLVFGLGPVTGLWLYDAGGQSAPFLAAPLLGVAGAVAIALSLRRAAGPANAAGLQTP